MDTALPLMGKRPGAINTYLYERNGPAGFEPATSSARGLALPNVVKLEGFDVYLTKVLSSDKDIDYLIRAANKYHHVLTTGNASELLALSAAVKRQTMRALAHLAKFSGIYEQWQRIIKQHGIHWRQPDVDFKFFEKESITEMIAYIKKVVKILPRDCGNTFIVATMLGL